MDCIVHGVAKSQTRLSDFHFHFSDVAIRRGEGAQRKRCWDPRCSPRVTRRVGGLLGLIIVSYEPLYFCIVCCESHSVVSDSL